MTIPEDQIISRGHAARARRRVRRLAAGALATGALAAAAIAATVTAPHAGQTDIALTAWTVRNQSNGTIEVTIRELRDRAGLQRKLRAEGVRINIRFFGEPDPPCDVYLISVKVPDHPREKATILDPGAGIIQYGPPGQKSVVMIIRPSAIPAHAGIKVFVAPPASYANANGSTTWAIGTALVHASPQCTGS
jgi:hypothetical protein